MHSCELVVTPPAQGAALLLELGTLIIEGRNSKPGFISYRSGQCVQSNVSDVGGVGDRKENENSDVGRGALPKRPAASLASVVHLSPAKRNRDHDSVDQQTESEELKGSSIVTLHKKLQCFKEEDLGKIASTSQVPENLSVYEMKARLANAGGAPLRGRAEALWRDHTPLCIEVLLAPDCGTCRESFLLLERWTMSVYSRKNHESFNHITSQWLLHAVRSQLHFSQISAWNAKLKEEELAKMQEHQAKLARDLSPSERQRKLSRETCNFKKYESNCDHELLMRDDIEKNSGKDNLNKLRKLNVLYNLKIPDENYKSVGFQCQPLKHTFPITDIGNNIYLEVHLESLPRIEDIPFVNCSCSANNNDTKSRRKSKDVTPELCFPEDMLAIKLNAACCLVEKKSNHLSSNMESDESKNRVKGATFSTDLGVINLDMGSTSGISRKFSTYSTPNAAEFGYHVLSSRGSTPERFDVIDSNIETLRNLSEMVPENGASYSKDDDVYQPNSQVPLSKLISTDYLLVDDRMQTPCRQSGKHRCNCDDESDQGASKDVKNNILEIENIAENGQIVFEDDFVSSSNCTKKDYIGTGQKITSDEKKIKESTRQLRRQKKEARLRQMATNGRSNQSNIESKETIIRRDKKNDCGKKVRTCSYSDNSDGRSSPELVHYNIVCHGCHGCFCRCQESRKNNFECDSSYSIETALKDSLSTSNNWLYSSNNEKPSEISSTTSIPILQASKFDHVNRFGSFRNTVSRGSRDLYCFKQQTNGIATGVDSGTKSSVKSCNHSLPFHNCDAGGNKHCTSHDNNVTDFQKCHYSTGISSKILNSDDDYRPSTKKLISSATQTDDMFCECGNSLIPKCYECSSVSFSRANEKEEDSSEGNFWNNQKKSHEESTTSTVRMKRSDANHNLAAVSKSNLLMDAIVRANNMQGDETGEKMNNVAIEVLHDFKDYLISTRHDCVADDKNSDSSTSEMGHDKKVIDYNCDNSVNSILNNCECDKNIVYSDSYNNPSCTNNSLSNSMPLTSDTNNIHKDDILQFGNDALPTKTDLSILLNNNVVDDNNAVKQLLSNSHIKNISYKEKPPDINVKTDFVIKKPKLKRFPPTVDKISKIVMDRNHQRDFDKHHKKKTITVSNDNNNANDDTHYDNNVDVSFSSNQDEDNKSNKTYQASPVSTKTLPRNKINSTEEDHIILYEKGDYGTFGKIIFDNETDINDSSKSLQRKLSSKPVYIKNEDDENTVLTDTPTSTDHSVVPSTSEMDKFRWRLDSAASMVFHSRTGLPLTSSPAPLRRGKSCFDYDSSINSVSGIKSALYGLSNADLETPDPNPAWSPGSSPGSPSHAHTEASVFNYNIVPKVLLQQSHSISRYNKFRHGTSSGLLGSFEESVLNGRLEPAATVAGFTAEIGASGEFCPPHVTLPVTVFFYSLGDNTTSSPYLGHINLGRKGYCVPRAGTIQVTLFNPHGTVVKMFVVMYNLEDMPPHSRTFLRQRTLWGGTCLRYLIHLRFLTSKSGKVYLHTDIRIIVSRKADLDTAAAHSLSSSFVLNEHNGDKKEFTNKGCRRKVETGTFRKRTKSEIERRKLNRSNGCYELSSHCNIHGCNDKADTVECKKDINQNKQPFPINAMSLPSAVTKELSYELRSFTYGPENPKYSPR